MRTGGIDSSQIQSMIAQLKAHATRPQLTPPVVQTETTAAPKAEFSDALKTALDAVNDSQMKSSEMGKKFAMGDDSVSLSDLMITMQKSSINFQAAIQVRNKLVTAYHDIMNMQVLVLVNIPGALIGGDDVVAFDGRAVVHGGQPLRRADRGAKAGVEHRAVDAVDFLRAGLAGRVFIRQRPGRIRQKFHLQTMVRRVIDRGRVAVVRHIACDGQRIDGVRGQPCGQVGLGKGAGLLLVDVVVERARGNLGMQLPARRAQRKYGGLRWHVVLHHDHRHAVRGGRRHCQHDVGQRDGHRRVVDRQLAGEIFILHVDHEQGAARGGGHDVAPSMWWKRVPLSASAARQASGPQASLRYNRAMSASPTIIAVIAFNGITPFHLSVPAAGRGPGDHAVMARRLPSCAAGIARCIAGCPRARRARGGAVPGRVSARRGRPARRAGRHYPLGLCRAAGPAFSPGAGGQRRAVRGCRRGAHLGWRGGRPRLLPASAAPAVRRRTGQCGGAPAGDRTAPAGRAGAVHRAAAARVAQRRPFCRRAGLGGRTAGAATHDRCAGGARGHEPSPFHAPFPAGDRHVFDTMVVAAEAGARAPFAGAERRHDRGGGAAGGIRFGAVVAPAFQGCVADVAVGVPQVVPAGGALNRLRPCRRCGPQAAVGLVVEQGQVQRVAHLQRRGDGADLGQVDAAAGKHLADGVAQQHFIVEDGDAAAADVGQREAGVAAQLLGQRDDDPHRVGHRRIHAVKLAPLQADQRGRHADAERRIAFERDGRDALGGKQDAHLVERGLERQPLGVADALVLLFVDGTVEDDRVGLVVHFEDGGDAHVRLALDQHADQLVFLADAAQQGEDLLAGFDLEIVPVFQFRVLKVWIHRRPVGVMCRGLRASPDMLNAFAGVATVGLLRNAQRRQLRAGRRHCRFEPARIRAQRIDRFTVVGMQLHVHLFADHGHRGGDLAQHGQAEAHAAAPHRFLLFLAARLAAAFPLVALDLPLHGLARPRFAMPLHPALFLRVQLLVDHLRRGEVGAAGPQPRQRFARLLRQPLHLLRMLHLRFAHQVGQGAFALGPLGHMRFVEQAAFRDGVVQLFRQRVGIGQRVAEQGGLAHQRQLRHLAAGGQHRGQRARGGAQRRLRRGVVERGQVGAGRERRLAQQRGGQALRPHALGLGAGGAAVLDVGGVGVGNLGIVGAGWQVAAQGRIGSLAGLPGFAIARQRGRGVLRGERGPAAGPPGGRRRQRRRRPSRWTCRPAGHGRRCAAAWRAPALDVAVGVNHAPFGTGGADQLGQLRHPRHGEVADLAVGAQHLADEFDLAFAVGALHDLLRLLAQRLHVPGHALFQDGQRVPVAGAGGLHHLLGVAQLDQQALHFFHDAGIALDIGRQQAAAHVFVQGIEPLGNLAAGLFVERRAQAAVDDQNGLGQRFALLGDVATADGAQSAVEGDQRAVEQHDDQLVGTGGDDAGFHANLGIGMHASLSRSKHTLSPRIERRVLLAIARFHVHQARGKRFALFGNVLDGVVQPLGAAGDGAAGAQVARRQGVELVRIPLGKAEGAARTRGIARHGQLQSLDRTARHAGQRLAVAGGGVAADGACHVLALDRRCGAEHGGGIGAGRHGHLDVGLGAVVGGLQFQFAVVAHGGRHGRALGRERGHAIDRRLQHGGQLRRVVSARRNRHRSGIGGRCRLGIVQRHGPGGVGRDDGLRRQRVGSLQDALGGQLRDVDCIVAGAGLGAGADELDIGVAAAAHGGKQAGDIVVVILDSFAELATVERHAAVFLECDANLRQIGERGFLQTGQAAGHLAPDGGLQVAQGRVAQQRAAGLGGGVVAAQRRELAVEVVECLDEAIDRGRQRGGILGDGQGRRADLDRGKVHTGNRPRDAGARTGDVDAVDGGLGIGGGRLLAQVLHAGRIVAQQRYQRRVGRFAAGARQRDLHGGALAGGGRGQDQAVGRGIGAGGAVGHDAGGHAKAALVNRVHDPLQRVVAAVDHDVAAGAVAVGREAGAQVRAAHASGQAGAGRVAAAYADGAAIGRDQRDRADRRGARADIGLAAVADTAADGARYGFRNGDIAAVGIGKFQGAVGSRAADGDVGVRQRARHRRIAADGRIDRRGADRFGRTAGHAVGLDGDLHAADRQRIGAAAAGIDIAERGHAAAAEQRGAGDGGGRLGRNAGGGALGVDGVGQQARAARGAVGGNRGAVDRERTGREAARVQAGAQRSAGDAERAAAHGAEREIDGGAGAQADGGRGRLEAGRRQRLGLRNLGHVDLVRTGLGRTIGGGAEHRGVAGQGRHGLEAAERCQAGQGGLERAQRARQVAERRDLAQITGRFLVELGQRRGLRHHQLADDVRLGDFQRLGRGNLAQDFLGALVDDLDHGAFAVGIDGKLETLRLGLRRLVQLRYGPVDLVQRWRALDGIGCVDGGGRSAPGPRRGAWLAQVFSELTHPKGLATQQRQHAVRQRVGLGQHRGTCLLQDLAARQVGRFLRKVGILNPATRCRQVLGRRVQVRDRRSETVLDRTQVSAVLVDLVQGRVDGFQRGVRAFHGADVDLGHRRQFAADRRAAGDGVATGRIDRETAVRRKLERAAHRDRAGHGLGRGAGHTSHVRTAHQGSGHGRVGGAATAHDRDVVAVDVIELQFLLVGGLVDLDAGRDVGRAALGIDGLRQCRQIAVLDRGRNRHRVRVRAFQRERHCQRGGRIGNRTVRCRTDVGDGGGGLGLRADAAGVAQCIDLGSDLLGAFARLGQHGAGHASARVDGQRFVGGQTVGGRGNSRVHGGGAGGRLDGVVTQVGCLGAGHADVDGLVRVCANLELGVGQRTVQHVLAVELGGVGHAVQFFRQGGYLVLDRFAIRFRVGAVGGLNCQFANTLQQIASGAQATLSRLSQRDAVVGVTCGLLVTADLRREALGNCQTGGVVLGAVNTQAGGQTLQRGRQISLRAAQVTLRIQRLDVAVDDLRKKSPAGTGLVEFYGKHANIWRLFRHHHPVLAGLLGRVHGFIGTFDQFGLLFVGTAQRHPGRKRDQHLLVIVQEEMLGQFALQTGHGGSCRLDGGFRHQDQELLAAEAGDHVHRTQGFLDDFHQVLEGGVAGDVAVRVVELFEVVQVQHGNAQRRAAAVGPRGFAFEHVVQAAPVERTGQLVFAYQFAQVLELGFQGVDAAFRVLHFLARQHHLVARLQGLGLHGAGFLEHFVENAVELGDIVGLADLVRVTADLLVEVAGRRGHRAQAIDKGHHHVLDGELDVRQAVLELALLINDFLQAARGFFQRADIERAGDQALHGFDLAAQPAVVVKQLADVFQQQLEQAQQQFLLLAAVGAAHLDLEAQLLEAQADLGQRFLAVRFARGRAQRFGLGRHGRRAGQQRRHREGERAAQQFAQCAALLILGAGHFDAGLSADKVFFDQLRQHARIAVPVARLDGAVETAAEVGQVAGVFGQAGGELAQHRLRARIDGAERRRSCGGSGRLADAGDLVVNLAIGLGRGRDAAQRQALERLAGDLGRILLGNGGFAGHERATSKGVYLVVA
uniref:Uncharacterized protein n=1 Tax=Tanacetum cinerariifolium TaxID=118510 RepID=A0A699GIA2_TANCI|nr:hypothetical protein [Tanacetum cinerariifolium]